MLFVITDGTIPSSLSKLVKLQTFFLNSNKLSTCESVCDLWSLCVCICKDCCLVLLVQSAVSVCEGRKVQLVKFDRVGVI